MAKGTPEKEPGLDKIEELKQKLEAAEALYQRLLLATKGLTEILVKGGLVEQKHIPDSSGQSLA
jgi:hypothetical protein